MIRTLDWFISYTKQHLLQRILNVPACLVVISLSSYKSTTSIPLTVKNACGGSWASGGDTISPMPSTVFEFISNRNFLFTDAPGIPLEPVAAINLVKNRSGWVEKPISKSLQKRKSQFKWWFKNNFYGPIIFCTSSFRFIIVNGNQSRVFHFLWQKSPCCFTEAIISSTLMLKKTKILIKFNKIK